MDNSFTIHDYFLTFESVLRFPRSRILHKATLNDKKTAILSFVSKSGFDNMVTG